jgi:hypothetical protein
MHCFRTLILRYCRYHRPVASWPPPWPIQICASNLERKFDHCQPSVQALKQARITLGSGANPRPGSCGTEIRCEAALYVVHYGQRQHEVLTGLPRLLDWRLVRPQSCHSVAPSAGSHVAVHKIDIVWAQWNSSVVAWLKWATRHCHGVVATQVA